MGCENSMPINNILVSNIQLVLLKPLYQFLRWHVNPPDIYDVTDHIEALTMMFLSRTVSSAVKSLYNSCHNTPHMNQSTTSDDAVKQIARRRHGTSRVSCFGPMERENCEISNTNRRHSELPQAPSALLFLFATIACCFDDELLVGGVASELFNNLYGHGSKSID